MDNQEIARVFYEVAEILDMQGENQFKVRAYKRAAREIEFLPEELSSIYKKGGMKALLELPGIGEALAGKIGEMVKTGHLEYLEKLKESLPMDMEALGSVEGLGPKKIAVLWKRLKIKNLKDLEKAAREGRIRKLPGMGERTEKQILENLRFVKAAGKRMPLNVALPLGESIVRQLQGKAMQASLAGSIRRRKDTIGDIDVLAAGDPGEINQAFVSMAGIQKVLVKGETKTSVMLDGVKVDLRIVKPAEWGSALMYFTGSKDHNIELRRVAQKKGWKLSEYGLFSGDKVLASKTEKEVYKRLGLPYLEPELREDRGETKLKEAPTLVGIGDVKGDLHVHSNWSDGNNTIEEMASAAKGLGYEYLAITDHTKGLGVANGLDEKSFENQWKELEAAEKKVGIRVLKGCEVNITASGGLDLDRKILGQMDVVVASIHSGFRSGKEKIMQRYYKAIEGGLVDIIAHPTGRLINQRAGFEIGLEGLVEKCKGAGVFLEINSFPTRLDLNDSMAKGALDSGCKVSVNTDSHHTSHLDNMRFGVFVARRAWATKDKVINCLPLGKLEKALER